MLTHQLLIQVSQRFGSAYTGPALARPGKSDQHITHEFGEISNPSYDPEHIIDSASASVQVGVSQRNDRLGPEQPGSPNTYEYFEPFSEMFP